MGAGCRGGGQSYSACVRESPAGREPAVCALSLGGHPAGDVSGEGLGRAIAGVHASVSVMRVKSLLHRETWGAPQPSRLRGMLVTAENFFICCRKALAAVTSCRG